MLEIFAGYGGFSAACSELGLRIGVPVDRAAGDCFDVCRPKVLKELVRWLRGGLVWFLFLAPPRTR